MLLVSTVLQVNMVTTNTCCDGQLEVLGLFKSLFGDVGRVEWCGDQDISIRQMLIKLAVRRLLVVSNDISMTLRFEPLTQAKLIFDTAFGEI